MAAVNWARVTETLLEKGDLPGTSEVVRFVLSIDPADEYSAQDLAALILKDYGLTNRVIRLANSCFYNPSGTEITTVSRAIVFLGFDFIREIALATSLLETILAQTPRERREEVFRLLGHSYFCAFLARRMSPHLRLDHEEIFIFTLFHRLVRVLLLIHLPEAYEALVALERKNPHLARQRLFAIGERLARKWSLPRALTETLEGSPKVESREHLAHFITGLDQACEVFLERGDAAPLRLFFESQGLSPQRVDEFVEAAFEAMRDLNPALSGSLRAPSRTPADTDREPERVSPEEFFQKALSEITALLASPDFDYQEVLLMVIETICRALECRNVFLGVLHPRERKLVLRYGVGEGARSLRHREVPVTPLLEEIFQKQVEWSGRVSSLPEGKLWMDIAPGADLLFSPLLVFGKPVGMIFALRERPFSLEDNQKVATLRNLAVLSIVHERQRKRGDQAERSL